MEMSNYVSKIRMNIQEQQDALKYLKFLMPDITKILFGVMHAEVYELSEKKEWEEAQYFGSLYICETNNDPKYYIMIPSKKSLDILFVPIIENMPLEIKIIEQDKIHAIYLQKIDTAQNLLKTYCLNLPTPDLANEAFSIINELKTKESKRKYPRELKKEIKEALKTMILDEEFIEIFSEKMAIARSKSNQN